MTPLIALYIVGRVVIGLLTTVACGLLPGMFKYIMRRLCWLRDREL